MSDMKVTDHRKVEIYVEQNSGVFYTKDDSDVGELRERSLDDLKKLIDEQGGKIKMRIAAFQLSDGYGDPAIEPCVITSIVRTKWGHEAWVKNRKDGSGSREKVAAHAVYEDTTNNQQLAKRWLAQAHSIVKMREEMEGLKKRMTTAREIAARTKEPT